MNLNINPEIDSEISELIEKLEKHSPDFRHEDGHYMEFKTPYLTNPDSRNEEWKNKIGIVFYPELLSYTDRYVDPETNKIRYKNLISYKFKCELYKITLKIHALITLINIIWPRALLTLTACYADSAWLPRRSRRAP